MHSTQLQHSISDAKSGDEIAREQLIRHYKPYIINAVGHICHRYITWSDEEASIGLLSCNKAIDTFNSNGGRTFLNYLYLLIKRDLIDYFRKQQQDNKYLINQSNEDISFKKMEVHTSIEQHQQVMQSYELVEEILELDQALAPYGISFEELEQQSPKHKDTRLSLIEMADSLIKHEKCLKELLRKKRLPISLFTQATNYRPKTVEKHRKYLITLVIIKLHPEWRQLSSYVVIPSRNEGLK